jgi:hypothetical protein
MIFENYQKRKNVELFKNLEEPDLLFLSNPQNYIPIYNKFFALNDTNFNFVNLNHKWYIANVINSNEYINNLYECKLKHISNNNKSKVRDVFFKLAPLLDPYKYLIGKYEVNDPKLFHLPKLNSTEIECHTKFIDPNNSAYVDGLFLYLTSYLIHEHNFHHGVDYYGSFLGIKNNFKLNVFDDIEYLNDSDFFNKNINVLFKLESHEHLFNNGIEKLKPIHIDHNVSAKSQLSIQSFDNEIYDEIFEKNVEINSLDEISCDLVDLTNMPLLSTTEKNNLSLKSTSSCSSRSSHTDIDDNAENNCDNCGDKEESESEGSESEGSESGSEKSEGIESGGEKSEGSGSESEGSESLEEEIINVIIPKFPVQIICMEHCQTTFDDLILNEELSNDEWHSSLMQIIMILITYQKAFAFTHNDLHTNNVMYNQTDKKYIYYCYKKKYYKVPTFGRIFKIIDFGRSIYKFDGKLFCSDSFQAGGDAATQYNTEPYLNDKKPRLEPNYSFDLCRLACSIFDYVTDYSEIKNMDNCKDSVKKLIMEWCMDDKGINVLYKNNGDDRYPDFKLYKMIARCVHNHTPQAQLDRPEFDAFSKFKGEVPNDVINIDNIPVCV